MLRRQQKVRIDKIKRVISTLVRRPRSITRVINWEEEMQRYVFDKYDFPIGFPVKDILSLASQISDVKVVPYTFSYGSALSIEIAMLKALAKEKEKCRFLEIGTYRGETAANLAEYCESVVTVDISNESYVGEWCRGYPNVRLIIEDSTTLDWEALGKFDLIFIDGNHKYHWILSDTKNAFKVLNDDGVIVWHDYIMRFDKLIEEQGHIRWEVLAGILDGCVSELHSNLYHINHTMSAVFCNKELEAAVDDRFFELVIK